MKVNNPYISIRVGDDQFLELRTALKKKLNHFEIKHDDLPDPHISIAYMLGSVAEKELDLLVEEVLKNPLSFDISGLEVLKSEYYGGYIIALNLIHNDDFYYSQDLVKEFLCDESVCVREDFSGGFKAHISLFLIKDENYEALETLARFLEIELSGVRSQIKASAFSIYDDKRQKVSENSF